MERISLETAQYIGRLLQEVKANLLASKVYEPTINAAIMNACGNMCGNAYGTIVDVALNAGPESSFVRGNHA